MPRTIEEILAEVRIDAIQRRDPVEVPPDTPVSEVLGALERRQTGAVVISEGERAVGIFTDRDVLHRAALGEIDGADPISRHMSSELVTLRPEQRVGEAIAAMNRGGYRHMPLVDRGGRLCGMISSRDIARFVAGHFPQQVLNLPPRLHQRMPTPEGG